MNDNTKHLLASKTFWVNILAVIAMLAQSYTGFVLSPEAQASILAGLNIGLRIVTKSEVVWG